MKQVDGWNMWGNLCGSHLQHAVQFAGLLQKYKLQKAIVSSAATDIEVLKWKGQSEAGQVQNAK